ncbi:MULTISPECIES: cell division protein ZapB [Pasteurellaceae]|uniref:Cell division protein ZapB n=1 Tax=Pasteurella atlantica TaxID=2827233 RepID=A0AAW8CQK7_9PAST|nr:cell division protein ZapB [Pasteurella atlantica]MBR0573944.1 cell division protein ZapB [Pasteurella atlantica]MDP8039912.1 cell division protein ZapB [Pasteurella atlantica]MDP8042064.1 cell division protein ZapB [Pasteurella atlantica]MDP8044173.1 cell division protein ZapB [Pasteurella atlantica]MDP8046263.1 cell division protein ZapB [Pasteurella atlantica]
MSVEILDQLEKKIRETVETIQLLQLEVEEFKGKNNELNSIKEKLTQENEALKAEQDKWQDRVRSLLGQIDNI